MKATEEAVCIYVFTRVSTIYVNTIFKTGVAIYMYFVVIQLHENPGKYQKSLNII